MTGATRGSAAVEAAAAALTGALLLSGTLAVGRLALALRRTHALARHAAMLSAAGVPADILDNETRDYAVRLGAPAASLILRRYAGTPAAGFYRLAEAVVTIAVPGFAGEAAREVASSAALEEEAS